MNLPALHCFDNAEEDYSTLFHELTHSSGQVSGLNREILTQAVKFGDTNYSKEELVAEMGAEFLDGLTGIEQVTIENSAAYLNSWIRRSRAIRSWSSARLLRHKKPPITFSIATN